MGSTGYPRHRSCGRPGVWAIGLPIHPLVDPGFAPLGGRFRWDIPNPDNHGHYKSFGVWIGVYHLHHSERREPMTV